jgi:1-acyl-sn-glycerol-3-phosphate acyltransferase
MEVFKSVIVWVMVSLFIVIMFPITFIIWLLVLPFDKKRNVTHWVLMHQGFLLCWIIPVWKVEVEGREKAVRGQTYVIISNHQSMLDIVLIFYLRYRFKSVSKIENTKIPILGWYIKMADYITVNRVKDQSKSGMLDKSLKCLKEGTSIMIFPEGTRANENEIGRFKRGAFLLAIQADCPILPVLIDGTGGILPKDGLVFAWGKHIRIRVLDPVLPSSFGTKDNDELGLKLRLLMNSELKKLRANNVKL